MAHRIGGEEATVNEPGHIATRAEASAPAAASIRAQLDRMLGSECFAHAPSLARLLRFIVEQTLAGQAHRLKEYTLGVEVFERGGDFDPRVDTIVRVQGRRLRTKLREYYAGSGRDDPILIALPKGHYVPVFEFAPTRRSPQRRPSRWRTAIAVAAIATLAMATLAMLASRPASPPVPANRPPAVVVLPFQDLSESRDQEHIGDGLAEELIHLLAQSSSLRVIARTSAFAFKDRDADIATIARALDVTHVLEGSVRRAGDRVRIAVQLIDAANATHLWSQIYEREIGDLLALQRRIAEAVATTLHARLGSDAQQPSARQSVAQAHADYLQGLFFFNRRAPGDMQRARECFTDAVRLAPEHARAWAGLAGVHFILANSAEMDWREGMDAMRAAAERALEIDPNQADARIRLAQYLSRDAQTRAQAREQLLQAWRQSSDSPLVLSVAAGIMLGQRQPGAAVALQRAALVNDPLSVAARINLAGYLLRAGQIDAAEAELDRVVEISPDKLDQVRYQRGIHRLIQRRPVDALALFREMAPGIDRSHGLALAHASLGREDDAEAALAELDALAGSATKSLVARAEIDQLRGDGDSALRRLAMLQRPHTVDDASWRTASEIDAAARSPLLFPLFDLPAGRDWLRATYGAPEPLCFPLPGTIACD